MKPINFADKFAVKSKRRTRYKNKRTQETEKHKPERRRGQTKMEIRKTTEKDVHLIYGMIKGLALYEKRPADVTGSVKALRFWLFEKKIATAVIAELNGEPIGYAIYYPVFASFATKTNAHIEDLFIKPEYRGKGFGKEFFRKLTETIKSDGYSDMEWSCLSWNAPSIAFYNKLGAKQENGRVYFGYSGQE